HSASPWWTSACAAHFNVPVGPISRCSTAHPCSPYSEPAREVQMPGKVVLFFPSYYSDEAAPPLALIHLAAPLVDRGHEVRIVDSAVTSDCVGAVLEQCADAPCLGISMVTGPMITQGVEVARAVKDAFPRLPVIAGGWHA